MKMTSKSFPRKLKRKQSKILIKKVIFLVKLLIDNEQQENKQEYEDGNKKSIDKIITDNEYAKQQEFFDKKQVQGLSKQSSKTNKPISDDYYGWEPLNRELVNTL